MNEQFRLGYQKRFRADHALIGGDWGAENTRHGHDYLWEVRLEGSLDSHGYLVDLVALEAAVKSVLSKYDGGFLNDLPGLQGLNPSVERFARQLGLDLLAELAQPNLRLESVLWENDHAWAAWSSL